MREVKNLRIALIVSLFMNFLAVVSIRKTVVSLENSTNSLESTTRVLKLCGDSLEKFITSPVWGGKLDTGDALSGGAHTTHRYLARVSDVSHLTHRKSPLEPSCSYLGEGPLSYRELGHLSLLPSALTLNIVPARNTTHLRTTHNAQRPTHLRTTPLVTTHQRTYAQIYGDKVRSFFLDGRARVMQASRVREENQYRGGK